MFHPTFLMDACRHARRSLRATLLCFAGCVSASAADEASVQQVLDTSMHATLACADCHDGFDQTLVAAGRSPGAVDCSSCHEKLEKAHAFHPDFAVQPFKATKQTDCASCHGSHAIAASKKAFAGATLVTACGSCHTEAARHFEQSAHGVALTAGRTEAPDCLTCHRDGRRGAGGRVAEKLAQSQLCLSCHLSNPRVVEKSPLGLRFIEGYGQSVHGAALTRGKAEAANCVDCHGSHEMNRALVADSRVNKLHIAETCAGCHRRAAREFGESVHAAALAKGNVDAPVCTDCHGEHRILVHTDPQAPVEAHNVSQAVCGACHGSVKLNQRYGLASDRFRTFADSYHGLATRGGSTEAVNCASCHGSHAVRPSSDPLSSIAKANIAQTCGQCHPGANERFAVGSVHVDEQSEAGDPWVYWVATFYVWLIVGVIGGMIAHNLLDFVRKIRRKIAIQKGEIAEPILPHRLYLRMTVNERLQHATLVHSFVILVVTGFMLRYPDAWWVVKLRGWSDHLFAWRSGLHRVAGVAMLLGSVWHIAYLAFTQRGRELFRDLLPRWGDANDALGVLRYNLGFAKEKPRFARFSYIEKAEYWALVWGTMIMGATGAVLWFENTFIGLLTKRGYDISRTVHFYEAILATLAILVWHLYFVIFNPDVYPMNLSWLTGRMSEKEMHDEHPLELERLKAQRRDEAEAAESASRAQKTDVAPPPPAPPEPPSPPRPPGAGP